MSRVSFPKVLPQLAAIETGLPKAGLSEVRRTIEKLTSLKTDDLARSFFSEGLIEAAMQRTQELWDKEVAINHRICRLRRDLGDLAIRKDCMDPEQGTETLDAIGRQIFSCDHPATHSLKKQLNGLEKQWKHLQFVFAFPEAEELNPDSFQSNFYWRLTDHIKTLKSDDPERACSLQKTLNSLVLQCRAAEEIYAGKGLHLFQRLPHDIRHAIERRLFSLAPDGRIDRPEHRAAAADAVMRVLMDRLMKIDLTS